MISDVVAQRRKSRIFLDHLISIPVALHITNRYIAAFIAVTKAYGLAERIRQVTRLIDLYPGYFTFTFLRNPYRRFLSLYRHATLHAATRAARIPDHPSSNGTLREFAELCTELLADTGDLWGAHANAFFRLGISHIYLSCFARYQDLGVDEPRA